MGCHNHDHNDTQSYDVVLATLQEHYEMVNPFCTQKK